MGIWELIVAVGVSAVVICSIDTIIVDLSYILLRRRDGDKRYSRQDITQCSEANRVVALPEFAPCYVEVKQGDTDNKYSRQNIHKLCPCDTQLTTAMMCRVSVTIIPVTSPS